MSTGHLIVVGVDGSEGGRRALDWAATEATARGGAVRAVIAWSWNGLDYGPVAAVTPTEEDALAAQVVAAEVDALAQRHGSRLAVTGEAIEGSPADVLTAVAHDADLLVLGSHGHSRVRHTVLGSVSESCIRKATCPVVVIPAPVREPAAV
ncbi:universal stress protein [Actinoplanes philippinensis]|uniref:Nucleotide-binding universal stress protein, UspA family n=1 Tax=Actinoplanes philippinensis TaxID=35752 RepID=A0A1I2CUU7_9ACTN|nr:universal stress protein [Actinoplanes philippinensis]GIE74670.1 universal stress protein [Actinoplanes philippinensis]SFE71962.1 Nucleotide-binding universal stress protein, UspA family [Actinoplanes philippinensis]